MFRKLSRFLQKTLLQKEKKNYHLFVTSLKYKNVTKLRACKFVGCGVVRAKEKKTSGTGKIRK